MSSDRPSSARGVVSSPGQATVEHGPLGPPRLAPPRALAEGTLRSISRPRAPAGSASPAHHADAHAGVGEASPVAGLEDLGQAASYEGRILICDLSSPIAIGAEPRYRLGPSGAERSSADRLHAYLWTVRRRADGRPIWQTVTADPELRIPAAATGQYRVEVTVLADGEATDVSLGLDQDVEPEPAALTAGLHGASAAAAQAMRELVSDLGGYVVEAAAATGAHGITARVLAAVLFIEILGRPRPQRERELDDIDRLLDAFDRGERVLFPTRAIEALDRPLGVGQIRPATAAMAIGATAWIDHDPADRRPARDRIRGDYQALPQETKRAIFTQLRWSRSNIATAARLLGALKNRSHRYPALTRAQFAADPRAVGIVATEYAGGASATPAADATPSGHGRWVWHQMQEPLMQRFFPDD